MSELSWARWFWTPLARFSESINSKGEHDGNHQPSETNGFTDVSARAFVIVHCFEACKRLKVHHVLTHVLQLAQKCQAREPSFFQMFCQRSLS